MLRPIQTRVLPPALPLQLLTPALVLAAFLLPAARPALAQSDFSAVCDGNGDAFVTQGEDDQSTTGLFEIVPSVGGLTFDPLGEINADANAIGFYQNYLYGSVPNTSDIIQIASDGTIVDGHPISWLPARNYIAGAVDASTGDYYLHAPNSNTVYVVSLATSRPAIKRFFTLSGDTEGLVTADFAYVDGFLYGYAFLDGYGNSANELYRINARTGEADFITVSPSLPTDTPYGAVWADTSASLLYLYANDTGEVFEVDLTTNTSRPVSTGGPVVDRNDGAACAGFESFGAQLEELPVELAAFEAVVDGSDVLLQWQTVSETDNAGFEIEHHDGGTWQRLAFIDGHGTTLETQTYRHRVEALSPGAHRFRLKQVDQDGAFAYSPEAEVRIDLPSAYALTTPYPNPFNPQTSFSLTVARQQEVTVSVYDVLGRRVALLFAGVVAAGQPEALVFEAGSLPSGIYVIHAEGETFTATQPVTLAK